MAVATLEIAGRRYEIACHDGDEARFEALGRIIDDKARDAARLVGGSGGIPETRQLLLAAVLLANDLQEARSQQPPAEDPEAAAAIEALTRRIDAVAQRLEKAGALP